jgi:integrase
MPVPFGSPIINRWSRDMDFTRRTVTVMRSKNGERRTIPVNETALDVLKEKSKVLSLASDRVFCSKAFTPMESGHLRRSFRLALSKAKIEEFISTISGISLLRGWCRQASISTRCSSCLGTSRPSRNSTRTIIQKACGTEWRFWIARNNLAQSRASQSGVSCKFLILVGP